MSTAEITTDIAEDIRNAHNAAEDKVNGAKTEIDEAIKAKIHCAAIVEAARADMGNTKFWEFWRDRVQLAKEEGRRYLALHHHAGNRLVDKQQLRLIGIIDPPEESEPQQRRPVDPFGWCKLVPKIRTQITDEWISQADEMQRATARKTLEPIVELYNRLSS